MDWIGKFAREHREDERQRREASGPGQAAIKYRRIGHRFRQIALMALPLVQTKYCKSLLYLAWRGTCDTGDSCCSTGLCATSFSRLRPPSLTKVNRKSDKCRNAVGVEL
jgi:hypothetical protein